MKHILSFARRYLLPYLHWYLAGVVMLFATNWISVTIPLYVAEGIDAISQDAANRSETIQNSAMVVMGLGVVVIFVRTLSRLLFFTPGRLVEARVKHDIFAKLLELQPSFHSRWPTGDIISRASSDVNLIRLFAGFAALGIVNTTVSLSMTTVQMIRISPKLAFWMVIPLTVGFLFTMFFLGKLYRIMKQMQEQAAELSDHALSSYQGIATVQAFRAESYFRDRFAELNEAYLHTTFQRANLRTVVGPVLSLSASINVFVLLLVGGPMAIRGELSIGELVAFTTLVALLTGPLRGLSFIIALFKQSQAAMERLDEILLAEPERPDLESPSNAAPAPQNPPALSVRNLSFAYPEDPEHTVLRNLNFEIGAGQTLGILGLTGSGKTTLVRCLARLYNPPPGTVFIDGVDVLDLDLDDWRRQTTLVSQKPFLFSETLASNVLLGESDDDLLDAVVDRTSLRTDLQALPEGLHTQVGESGVRLSGGQRQRVALARGLARTTQVLMLDSVLSAVDHATEHELIAALQRTRPTPTTVIISNRLSALQHADHILVMDDGVILDQGTHEELTQRPGMYLDTWQRQNDPEGSQNEPTPEEDRA